MSAGDVTIVGGGSVGAKVRSWSYQLGRQDEGDPGDAGTASIVCDNNDGFYSDGTYDVTPGQQLALSNPSGGTRWSGTVEARPLGFDDPTGNASTLSVALSDCLGRLNRRTLASTIEEETAYAVGLALAGGGDGYMWSLGEPSGAVMAEYLAGSPQMELVRGSSLTLGGGGVSDQAPTALKTLVDNSVTDGAYATLRSPQPATRVALMCWMNGVMPPGQTGSPRLVGLIDQTNFMIGCSISVDMNLGNVSFGMDTASGGGWTDIGGPVVNDGQWHHIVGTYDGTTMRLYVDGKQYATAAATPSGSTFPQATIFGGPNTSHSSVSCAAVTFGNGSQPITGSVVANLYRAGRSFKNVDGSTAWSDICRWTGMTTTAPKPIGIAPEPVDIRGASALSVLQQVATAADGAVYSGSPDSVTLVPATQMAYNLTVASPTVFAAGEYEHDLAFAGDLTYFTNKVSVTAGTGVVKTAQSASQIAAMGEYPQSLESPWITDDKAADVSGWHLATRSDIGEHLKRLSAVTIDLLTASATLRTKALGVSVGEPIQLTGLPAKAPATTLDLVVQGIQETNSVKAWSITFNTVPASLFETTGTTSPLILDHATYGQLKSTNRVYY